MRFSEGATFWVDAQLQNVWLQWRPPLTAADAAYFLADPVMAVLLRRKGVLSLHASAVAFGPRAVLFAGAAGAGKSIAAAACVAGSAALVTDDVAALRLRDGGAYVSVGPAAIRAWDDGAAALLGDAKRAPPFSPAWEKRVIAPELLGGRRATADVRVALICSLGERAAAGTGVRLAPLGGRAALEAILPVTAANHLHDPETRAEELGQLAAVLRAVPAVRLLVDGEAQALRSLPGAICEALGD